MILVYGGGGGGGDDDKHVLINPIILKDKIDQSITKKRINIRILLLLHCRLIIIKMIYYWNIFK